MSMEYLFISLCLQFLSSMTYSFQCTGLSPPWLNLFLGILFDATVNGIVFLIPLSNSLLSVTETHPIFVYWFCTLPLYWICILVLTVLVESLGFSIYNMLSGFLFLMRFLNADSISLLVISLFRFSISSWFSLGRLYDSKNLSFLLGCPTC